jgi:radical SAM protein with 4Fe4S-binding SPASM domain
METTKKLFKQRAAHDIIPHLCQIELTYACNADCIFCYNPVNKIGDLGVMDKVVESVASSHIPHVYLFGGEPSLLPVKKLNDYIELLSEHSSVTIVTNGIKRLEGISNKLACFGIPIHGSSAESHEFLNRRPGSFEKILENIKYYIACGHDVRCIPVLTAYNYNQMYDIIKLAANLGMESVYVDRYEDGGKGAANSSTYNLKPTSEQFEEAVSQIIKAKRDFISFKGRIGFGTAIPYCLDNRLTEEGLNSSCGAGITFCAINPNGDLRVCNQSQLVFGNILDEPIEKIWNKSSLDIFRNLNWITEPCTSCQLLLKCLGGCKVDVNCSDKFCVDYSIRGLKSPPNIVKKQRGHQTKTSYPEAYRFFEINRFLKLTTKYNQKFLVTRYQTIQIDEMSVSLIEKIMEEKLVDEKKFINYFSEKIEEKEIRLFFNKLLSASAIELIKND